MDRKQFWELIDSIAASEDRENSLRKAVKRLSDDELITYQEHFDTLFEAAYDWKLWGAAYLVGGGCSDDSFIDFRYGVISRGKEFYESLISDPDSLADFDIDYDELFDEVIGYVALDEYESRDLGELPRRENTFEDPQGEEWDFDDDDEMQAQLPALFEKLG